MTKKRVLPLAQTESNWTSDVPNNGLGSVYDGFRKLKLTENLSAQNPQSGSR